MKSKLKIAMFRERVALGVTRACFRGNSTACRYAVMIVRDHKIKGS